MEPTTTINWEQLQEKDDYNAIHIRIDNYDKAVPALEFETHLLQLLKQQTEGHQKSIWVHLGKHNLSLTTFLIQQQFKIHHGLNDVLVFYKWLSPLSDAVPPYSRFYIGCGAAVIVNNKLLLIMEKNGHRKGSWGIPGGLCDQNEPIADGCLRELWEETGLRGTYKYLLYFRQQSLSLYGSVDLFFVGLIEMEQSQTKNIKICQREIAQYRWVPLDQLSTFTNENKIGSTQIYVLRYIIELHAKKFNFYGEMPNTTTSHTSNLRGTPKYYKEHRLITFPN